MPRRGRRVARLGGRGVRSGRRLHVSRSTAYLGAVDGMPRRGGRHACCRRQASCALPCRAIAKAARCGDDRYAFRSNSSGELDEGDDVLARDVRHPARGGCDAGGFQAFRCDLGERLTFSAMTPVHLLEETCLLQLQVHDATPIRWTMTRSSKWSATRIASRLNSPCPLRRTHSDTIVPRAKTDTEERAAKSSRVWMRASAQPPTDDAGHSRRISSGIPPLFSLCALSFPKRPCKRYPNRYATVTFLRHALLLDALEGTLMRNHQYAVDE
jgi:hypothetical protein